MARAKLVASSYNRLSSIKSFVYKDPVKCSKCGRMFSKEKAFNVTRWSSGKTTALYIYCRNCASSPEDVILIIDTDNIPYGIAYIDDFFDYKKIDERQHLLFQENLLKGFLRK